MSQVNGSETPEITRSLPYRGPQQKLETNYYTTDRRLVHEINGTQRNLPMTCCWYLNEGVNANITYQFHSIELGSAAGLNPKPRPSPRPPTPEPPLPRSFPRPTPLPRPPSVPCNDLAVAAASFAA